MNKIIEKINFKKLIVVYIIIGLIVGVGLMLFIGNKFQDKLEFIYHYHKISEEFEKENYNINNIKEELKNMSNNSSDIIDALILDKDNAILYSSKDSQFGKQEKFILNRKENSRKYFISSSNNDIVFQLIKDKELMVSTILSNFDLEIESEYNDEVFFESEINNQKIYMLSYTSNKETGEKIYFINEIHPVQNGENYVKIALAVIMFCFMLYWVIVALFVYQNALKSKLNPYLWGGITLLTNIAGVFIYLIYKQNNKTCYKCGTVQNRNNVYCTHCGTKLNETCKNCGAIIEKIDNYCNKCGEKQK